MGGKQKQAQRTKNNARPSNSGRSAELLSTTLPHFSNLGVMKESGFSGIGFSLSGVEDVDTSIDTNYQLVFKKMNKKDSITKIKGLQEFTKLISNADQESVKTILPFWPRYYCALAVDIDHKVREASHVAHNQVVLKAKKFIAPHLKQLIGPWFISQYDNYAPASSAATQAFQDAFPPNKIQEVIIYCQMEILNYICDNITKQTIQSVASIKMNSFQDCKMKYERLVIASLQAYSFYLKNISQEAVLKCEQVNREIISSPKFWNLAQNETPHIRGAFYSVLAALCQKVVDLVKEESPNATKVVFSNMNENDPVVQGNLWEALLLIISTIDEWWEFVKVDEVFLPKLWCALKDAGHGNAVVIYPSFLPLLSHLPDSIDMNNFSINFFTNMRLGLVNKTNKMSALDHRIIYTTYVECLQYLIVKNFNNQEFCNDLILSHLLPFIDWCLKSSQTSYKTSFSKISALIQSWYKNEQYERYIHLIWKRLHLLLMDQTDEMNRENKENYNELISRQLEFLITLKHIQTTKKRVKVKFAEDSNANESESINATKITIDERYLNELNSLAVKLSIHYVHLIETYKIAENFQIIYSMIQEFDAREIFCLLGKTYANNTFYGIFSELISKWINNINICTNFVVDITFALLKFLTEEEKMLIFNYFNKIENARTLGWCIARALSHPHNSDESVQKWLSSDNVGKFIVDIVRSEVNDTSSADLSVLFKQAFTETDNTNEFYINDQCILQVVQILSDCLKSPLEHTLTIDTCASLAAYISSIIYTESLVLKFTPKLIVALFSLNCSINSEADYITSDTLWEVHTAWQDSLQVIAGSLSDDELMSLIDEFALIIVNTFIEDKQSDCIVEKVSSLLDLISKLKPFLVESTCLKIFDQKFIIDFRRGLKDVAQLISYFNGSGLNFNEKCVMEIKNSETSALKEMAKYFKWKNYFISVVFKSFLNKNKVDPHEDDEDNDDNDDEEISLHKLIDQKAKIVLDVIEDIVIADLIIRNCKNVNGTLLIEEGFKKLNDNINEILMNLTQDDIKEIENELEIKKCSDNILWPKIAYLYYIKLQKQKSESIYQLITKGVKVLNAEERIQMLLTFGNGITYDDINQSQMDDKETYITLRCLAHCDEIEVQIAEAFGKIDRLRWSFEDTFYNIKSNNWEKTQTILEIVKLWKSLLDNRRVSTLTKAYWDLIVLSLASWTSKLNDLKQNAFNLQIASFIKEIIHLFMSVDTYIKYVEIEQPTSTIIDEWRNVFVEDITKDLVKLWMHFAEVYHAKQSNLTFLDLVFLQGISKVTRYINAKYIFNITIDAKWPKLLKQSCALLISRQPCLQLWGYQMLLVLSPGLIEIDDKSLGDNMPHKNGMVFEQFKGLLTQANNVVSALFANYRLGNQNCAIEPFTESYTHTFAYLLLWNFLLIQCKKSSKDLKYHYADWLRKDEFLSNLLRTLFKLMPLEMLQHPEMRLNRFQNWFMEEVDLSMEGHITNEKIERFACWIYASSLFQLPASVRQWWSNVDSKTSQIVEKITSSYVSSHFCAHELEDVTKHESKFKNMVIKILPTVREVIAIYTIDESQMELTIKLPINYPLIGPDVECNRQIEGTSHKQWLMQLKMCLLYQNGRIWDGLSLWNNNLDKKFDGVDECYICYAVLHPGTYQLPKLSCKTCRKKFHAACLYKWFSTSNKSTCPICRNLF